MLGQLRENPLVLKHYQLQLAIESPEPPPALETLKRPKRPKHPKHPKQPITLNFDKRFDTEFQSAYGLPSANEFPNMAKDELEKTNQKVTKAHKSVGVRKSAAKSTVNRDKLDRDLAKLKEYKKILDATKSTDLSEILGNGFCHQRIRIAYKLSKCGLFGHVYIDPAILKMNIVCVKDVAGNSVMDNVVDSSRIDLLTKRYNPKVEYTPEAKDIFKNLTKFSGLKKSRGSGKQKLLGGAVTLIVDNPKDTLTRINLLLGTRRAGNNSLDIRNEIVKLIDIAAAKNVINSGDKKWLTIKNNVI